MTNPAIDSLSPAAQATYRNLLITVGLDGVAFDDSNNTYVGSDLAPLNDMKDHFRNLIDWRLVTLAPADDRGLRLMSMTPEGRSFLSFGEVTA